MSAKQSNQKIVDSFISFLDSIEVLDFTLKSSFQAAKTRAELFKKGKVINVADSLIAGAMLSYGCKKIITHDKEHFERIQGIVVENY